MSAERPRLNSEKNISSVAENAINAFRVAPQWQLPAIGLTAVALHEGHQAVKKLEEGKVLQALPHAAVSVGTTLYGALAQSEVIGYVGEYNSIKERFNERGWDSWVISKRVRHFCGRRAARLASEDTGHGEEFKLYMSNQQEEK